jgi:nicotinamide mononucleotide adenylyltransferase
MISKILKALNIKFTIYALPDFDSDEDRKNYIIKNVTNFDTVISGNPRTSGIFKKTKYEVLSLKITKDIKSTAIRHMLYISDME